MSKKLFLMLTTLFLQSALMAQVGNTTLGTNAGASITTGDNNVLIGDNAGGNITSSSHNTFVGKEAGANQLDDLFPNFGNTFMGFQAGFNNMDAKQLTFIGFRAGYYLDINNTGGGDLTFVGAGAGFNMVDGDDSVFVGNKAGLRYTGGDDNTIIGSGAGGSSNNSASISTTATGNPATGSDNTIVGSRAGFDLTTGYRNTFLGTRAGEDVNQGYKNTFVGDSTGIDAGIGRLNTFIGQAAGAANEYSNYNTFIGSGSGGQNNRNNGTTNANRNTYVGTFAGYRNSNGEDNVGMGAFADYIQDFDILNIQGNDNIEFVSNLSRSRTTFLGAQAHPNNNDVIAIGYKARVDGQYGIVVGNNSRAQNTNAIAIGNTVDVSQDNTLALGGDQATNRLSVGIGTVAANLNASLDLADVDKGFMINRVTTAQRNTMTTAPASGNALDSGDIGLMVYDTTELALYVWEGTAWGKVGEEDNVGPATSAVPELLNYQSAIKDSNGELLVNQSVSFRMSIEDATAGNTTVYTEIHNETTSASGVVSFKIGDGIVLTGTFADIDWSHVNNLKVELDTTNVGNYTEIGTTSFVSVPYALHAKYAENVTTSTSAKMSNTAKEDRIKVLEDEAAALKLEVQELKILVNKLISKQ